MTSECLSVGLFVHPTRERKKEIKKERKKEREKEKETKKERKRNKERETKRKKERKKESKKEGKKERKLTTGKRPTKFCTKTFPSLKSTLPASSVEAERTFSAAGLFLPKIRSNLSDGSLDHLVFLWKYFQNKQGKWAVLEERLFRIFLAFFCLFISAVFCF